MRFRCTLMFLMCISFLSVYAQELTLLSYSCEARPLTKVLEDWKDQYGLETAFRSDLVGDVLISLSFDELGIEEAFQKLLEGTSMQFEVVDARYVVLKQTEALTYCLRILDEASRVPIPFVTLSNGRIGQLSDDQGQVIWNSGVGAESLFLHHLSYGTVEVDPSQLLADSCLEVALSRKVYVADAVEVTAFTSDQIKLDAVEGDLVFEPQGLPTLPGWGEPDVLRSLQMLPGIGSADESASNLNIRGGTPDQNLVLWDNIPIYHSGHFFGMLSAFNPFIVDKVSVYRGAFGVQYGGRVAGVIDMKSGAPLADSLNFGFGSNLLAVNAFLSVPLINKKSSIMIAGRRSFTDVLRSNTYQKLFDKVFQKGRLSDNLFDQQEEEEDIIELNPDFFFQDYNFKWELQATDRSDISVSAYLGEDHLDYAYSDDEYQTKDNLALKNWGISGTWKQLWGKKGRSETQLVYSSFENAYLFEFREQEPDGDVWSNTQSNELRDVTLVQKIAWNLEDWIKISGGLDLKWMESGFNYSERSYGSLIEFNRETSRSGVTGFFLESEWKAWQKLFITAGIRKDKFINEDEDGFVMREINSWQPRLRLAWLMEDLPLKIFGSTGNYRQYVYQMPTQASGLGSNEQVWVVADDFFPALKARHWDIGMEFEGQKWLVQAEYYRKRIENLNSWKLGLEDTVDDEIPFTGDGIAKVEGLDVLFRYRQGHYQWWNSYTYSRVRHQYAALNSGDFFPADHDFPHQFQSTFMTSFRQWDFSLSWQWRTGKPFTSPGDIDVDSGSER